MKAASSSVLLGAGFRTLLPTPNFGSLLRLSALAEILLPSQTTQDHPLLQAMPLCHLLQTVFPDSPSRTNHCLQFCSPAPECLYLCTSSACRGLPRWLSGTESAWQYGRHRFKPWVRKIPWRRKWQLTPVFFPIKSHGQKGLVGYSP